MWLIVGYCIHHIIINIHDDDDVMVENLTCIEGVLANNQTIALCHGVCPHCAQGCGEYFCSIKKNHAFWPSNGQNPSGGGSCTAAFWPLGTYFWMLFSVGFFYGGWSLHGKISLQVNLLCRFI
jgi:hypothetical protein